LKHNIKKEIDDRDKNKSGKNGPVIKSIGIKVNDKRIKFSKYLVYFIF
tara:strand:+ start:261 stop:404 length:144 start_codon:yes stop_codon:yes gene_type:complete